MELNEIKKNLSQQIELKPFLTETKDGKYSGRIIYATSFDQAESISYHEQLNVIGMHIMDVNL